MLARLFPIACLLAFLVAGCQEAGATSTYVRSPWWEYQSIDTMKYSRDMSREKYTDPSFDAVIHQQMKDIADAGATHVGIATPYDEEFVPYLKRWVAAARYWGLKVWFRGNWAGWEGWFGYPPMTREEHIKKTRQFILRYPELFEDGDIFTGCPECENGGPGDPRLTGDVAGHRKFLIELYHTSRDSFLRIGRRVRTNFNPMNGDVVLLVMDRDTTREMGGIVVMDHYVGSPEKLAQDVQEVARRTEGRIILGEFGAPIPDIHGNLSEEQQARWITEALSLLVDVPEMIGMNYWINLGGSTAIWKQPGVPTEAARVLASYFTPRILSGVVRDHRGRPLKEALVSAGGRQAFTDLQGAFRLPYVRRNGMITIKAKGFEERMVDWAEVQGEDVAVSLRPQDKGLIWRLGMIFEDFVFLVVDLIRNIPVLSKFGEETIPQSQY